jgi:hypothetical protein
MLSQRAALIQYLNSLSIQDQEAVAEGIQTGTLSNVSPHIVRCLALYLRPVAAASAVPAPVSVSLLLDSRRS